MAGKLGGKLPPASRTYVAVFLAALLVLAFFGPYMSHREVLSLNDKSAGLEQQIKEQELLFQAYVPMKQLLDDKDGVSVPEIKKAELSLDDTDRISVTLGRMAEDAGLKPLAIHPDLSSLIGGKGELVVDARAAGNFRGLRAFLHDVGVLPTVKDIVFMEIREVPQAREMHLKIIFHTKDQTAAPEQGAAMRA